MIFAAVFAAGVFTGGVMTKAQTSASPKMPAQRVTGIGGVFFKARDPKALSVWYRDTLGIPVEGGPTFSIFEWREREDPSRVGLTVWGVFPADTRYFESPVMLNYRVRDLDQMLAQLRALGVKVDPKVEDDFNGRFASIFDPEGNKIQLWEPKAGH